MTNARAGLLGKLSFLDRSLTLWIFTARVFGIALGDVAPRDGRLLFPNTESKDAVPAWATDSPTAAKA